MDAVGNAEAVRTSVAASFDPALAPAGPGGSPLSPAVPLGPAIPPAPGGDGATKPPARFALGTATSSRGKLRLRFTVPAAGRIAVRVTAKVTTTVRGRRRTSTLVYASKGSTPVTAGNRAFTVAPSRADVAALKWYRRLVTTITATFTPTGVKPQTIRRTLTVRQEG